MALKTLDEIKRMVTGYVEAHGDEHVLTQEVLTSGDVPELKGHVVYPGKVSDCLFGGEGEFKVEEELWESEYKDAMPEGTWNEIERFEEKKDKGDKGKMMVRVGYENEPIMAKNDRPRRDMVRTPKISTHDKGRGEIPLKDQVLAVNHQFMRTRLMDLLGNSQYDTGLPANAIVISAENLSGVDYEAVYRLFNAPTSTSTSLYVHWQNGETEFCGQQVPSWLYPAARLPGIWPTPSTKSGTRDVSVKPEELFEMGVVDKSTYQRVTANDVAAFGRVVSMVAPMGLILADTKLEHGVDAEGNVQIQDEVFTLDSSRYWLMSDYYAQLGLFLAGDEEGLLSYLKETQGLKPEKCMFKGADGKQHVGMVPRSYSKEFARGFSVGDSHYTDEQRIEIGVRYVDAIQRLTGQPFEPDMRSRRERIVTGLQAIVQNVAK